MSLKIAENTYDELGQLTTKGVGGKTSQSRLQEIDYAYNVRGWLKNINQDAKSDNDLFNFSLQYNDIAEHSKKLYNGNISGTSWSTASIYTTNTAVSNQYTYAYDALNRITGAEGTDTSNYDVSGISYDKNGNILSLKRHGHTNTAATSFGVMDDLTYSYDSGNKLTKVADAAPIDQFGFKDDAVNTAADTSNDYTYDANGNMKTDANKGITGISYNHLNLPTTVNIGGGTITYVYDATGVKQKKIVSTGTTTDYAGNYIYENNTLQFFNHPEGYVQHKNGIFSYVYQYKDHLGNVRLSYADVSTTNTPVLEIIEESNYYPFGLKHKGYNNATSSNGNSTAQKFKYNGIELEESLGLNLYEMDFRQFDPAIGRFTAIDPVTHWSNSTYNAFDNNPIYWADPSGADSASSIMDAFNKSGSGKTTWYNDGNGGLTDEEPDPKEGDTREGKKVVGNGAHSFAVSATQYYHSGEGTTKAGWYFENEYNDILDKIASSIIRNGGYVSFEGSVSWIDTVDDNVLKRLGNRIDRLLNLARAHSYFKKTGQANPMGFDSPFFLGAGLLNKVFLRANSSQYLYHYTTKEGYEAILASKTLNPSIGLKNARFGSGQYFTDIAPGTFTSGQLSYRLFGVPWNGRKLTHFLKVKTNGLNIIKNKPHNFLNPTSQVLDMSKRIFGGGKSF